MISEVQKNVSLLWLNPHLRWVFALLIISELGAIWFPHFQEQFAATQKVFLLYGLAVAANSAPDDYNKITEPKNEKSNAPDKTDQAPRNSEVSKN